MVSNRTIMLDGNGSAVIFPVCSAIFIRFSAANFAEAFIENNLQIVMVNIIKIQGIIGFDQENLSSFIQGLIIDMCARCFI